MTGDRELRLVELVSPEGVSIGSSTVADAHLGPGLLHRAFSVLLFDHSGRTLLQQRAGSKRRFPLIWANTCCGHPAPGEDPVTAAQHRLAEELGVRGVELTDAGVYTYAAADPGSGLVEQEFDHVLVGVVDPAPVLTPDPAEVAATRWTPAQSLVATGDEYAPWLAGVLSVARAFRDR